MPPGVIRPGRCRCDRGTRVRQDGRRTRQRTRIVPTSNAADHLRRQPRHRRPHRRRPHGCRAPSKPSDHDDLISRPTTGPCASESATPSTPSDSAGYSPTQPSQAEPVRAARCRYRHRRSRRRGTAQRRTRLRADTGVPGGVAAPRTRRRRCGGDVDTRVRSPSELAFAVCRAARPTRWFDSFPWRHGAAPVR